MVELFKKYGGQYDLDYLLMAAQGYQESRLDHTVKSPVGAIGVMQVMPPTGKELNVGDIQQIEPNIHAGVKYMRFMMDQYFKDEPMDNLNKGLMTFAAYNAGPGRLRQLRRETAERGLDPTCGSATSSAWPRSGLGAKPSPTLAISTSTTSRTVCLTLSGIDATRRRLRLGTRVTAKFSVLTTFSEDSWRIAIMPLATRETVRVDPWVTVGWTGAAYKQHDVGWAPIALSIAAGASPGGALRRAP